MNSSARDEARLALQVYQSRTGLTLGELATRMGFARTSVHQFASRAQYGDGEGEISARRILDFISRNPILAPQLPGKLYETESTREIDAMVAWAKRGRWGTLYGPAGSQKTFALEYRAAEAARAEQPAVVYVYASPEMAPGGLLRRIAAGVSAPMAQYNDALRESILWRLRQRSAPVAIVIDEAQNLRRRPDTLETLREMGDRSGAGLLLAGHDDILDLFEPRGNHHFAQWRSRIEQRKRRLAGLSRAEARAMIAGELGPAEESKVERMVDQSTERDPVARKDYVSARRLFNAIRDVQEKRKSQ